MGQAIGTLLFGIAFIAIPCDLALRLTPEAKRGRMVRWLLIWSLKGVALPLTLWAVMNLGISWNLQPFMPIVQAARHRGGGGWPEYFQVTSLGLYFISSYWSTLTLGWLLSGAVRAAEEKSRQDFRNLCLTCLLGLSIPVALILLFGGWTSIGLAGTLLLAPMAAYSRDLLHPPKMPPMYARAVARMKFGKYTDAEWEILKELENSEDDFDGWMMLADLYATHFHNLTEAEQTVLELCAQPTTTPSQFAVALHRLSDWHLRLAGNPDAARRALLMICDRLKGTHLAHMAQLRIDQLPASAAELREQQTARPIPLPALGDYLDEPAPAAPADLDKARKAANAYVEQLKQNPNNVAARERLARVFTERLEKPHLGIEQIELLLDMPDRSDAERANWLGLTAAWQIKYCRNFESGRAILERLVREFPNSVEAFAARRRLELLARQLNTNPRREPPSKSHA